MYPFRVAVKKYEELLEIMKERNISPRVQDRLICRCLYFTGEPSLVEKALALYKRYPALGFRPFKGAGYVHHRDLKLIAFADGLTGEEVARSIQEPVAIGIAHREGRGPEDCHEVAITPGGVLLCSCKDFQFNLKMMGVYQGPHQQPCCHILGAAMIDDIILAKFIQWPV